MKNRTFSHLLLTVFLMLQTLPAVAFMNSNMLYYTQSLEWQKIELEKNIKNRFNSMLAPIIKSGEYIIEVDIALKSQPGKSKPAGGGGGGGAKKKPNKSGLRLSDIDPKEAPGDYIVFSKLGLEAPLYANGEGGAGGAGGGKSESTQWKDAIIDLNSNYDLFRHMRGIKVFLKLDDYLGDETKATIKNLIDDTPLRFGKVKPEIIINYVDMQELKKKIIKKDPNIVRKELMNMLSRFGTAIGLITAALFLGIIGFFLFRKFAKLFKDYIEAIREASMNTQNAGETPKSQALDEEEDSEGKDSFHSADPHGVKDEQENAVDRFKSFMDNSFEDAALMVQKWINDPAKLPSYALNVLVRELKTEQLQSLFSFITEDERKVWKKAVKKSLNAEQVFSAKNYITSEIVQEMIAPSMIKDPEVVKILLDITPEACAVFATQEPKLASILMHVMQTKFITKMMKGIENSILNNLIMYSMNLNDEFVRENLNEFKMKISQHIKKDEVPAFMDRILELLPHASAEKETSLFQGIGRAGSLDLLVDTAMSYLPSEIILNLDDQLAKNMVGKYDRKKRVKLLMTLEESKRDHYVSLIAAPETKAREMLELEMERYSDEGSMKILLKDEDLIWQDFANYVRWRVKTEHELTDLVKPIVQAWAQQYSNVRELKQSA